MKERNITDAISIADGFGMFKKHFGDMLSGIDHVKVETAYYAGALAYDTIINNLIQSRIKNAEAELIEGTVAINVGELIKTLHDEVHAYAQAQVDAHKNRTNN